MRESALEFVRDAIEVVREELEHEVPRGLLGRPWTVVLLVGAEQDALAFLACVDLAGEVDHVRQFATVLGVVLDDLVHRFGHQVVVFHREHRQLESGHAADFACPEATRVDDVFGVDVALVRDDVPRAVLALLQVGRPGVGVDLGAAVACADGIGVRDAVGVHAAFVLVVQRADEVLLFEQRIQFLCFLHGDHLHVHAEVTTACLGHLQPVEALGRVGELQTTGEVDAAVLAGLLFDLLVQVHRVLLQARHVRVAVQRVHATGCVPGGTRRQLLALEEDDVRPALFGQVVEHGGSDDTSTDDDDAG